MNETSVKFPSVMTTTSVLGIDEGTVLVFDFASGKYVSILEEEDISEDYFYSGSAIAIDPYVVKENIGTYFTHIEPGEINDTPSHAVEVSVEEPQTEMKSNEELKEEFLTDLNQKEEPARALVVDCSCGHRSLVDVIKAPGINITLMAEDESSFVELTCKECGAKLKLWFVEPEQDELTEEESN